MAEISRSYSNWRSQIVLALDTSSTIASLALVQDQKLVATSTCDSRFPHSKTIFSSVQSILESTKVSIADIDIFVGVTGPGSFTGLRIGLAALKGLAHSVGCPVLGLDAISAYALSTKQPGKYLVCLEAGPSVYFIGKRQINDAGELVVSSLKTEDIVVHYQNLKELIQGEPGMDIVLVHSPQLNQEAQLLGHDQWLLKDIPEKRIIPADLTLAPTIALYSSKYQSLSSLAPYYLKMADSIYQSDGDRSHL